MVRTIKFENGSYVHENTLADGRVQAIKQAERVGSIDKDDHSGVRAFLEGHLPDESKSVDFYSTITGVASSCVTIYKIDG